MRKEETVPPMKGVTSDLKVSQSVGGRREGLWVWLEPRNQEGALARSVGELAALGKVHVPVLR